MAAAVQSAPRTVVVEKPSKHVDPQKQVVTELKRQLNAARNSNANYLSEDMVQKLNAWATKRLARIAKTQNPNLVMFCIGKSENENTVVYMGQLQPGTGKLRDDSKAAKGFWIDYAKAADGSREANLNLFDKMAYGYDISPPKDGERAMSITALPAKPMTVKIEKLPGEDKARVVARVECCGIKKCRLLAVYVALTSGLIPSVKYIDILAVHPQTGERIAERVTG